MAKKDNRNPRIDEYIAKAQPFAQPVLKHLREVVHKVSPDIEETIKWGMPTFEYKGIVCAMAGFKKHCAFIFFKSSLLNDPGNYLRERANKGGEAMGNLGKITSLKDIPPDKILIDFIKQAMKFNDDGIKLPSGKKPAGKEVKMEIEVPDNFIKALNKNKDARKYFETASPSFKKEYMQWITEAKTEETRTKRINQAIEWIAEGKGRNWKYERK
jgi:uncharacterized protein YdeI (YjbR/CyaY-like superfamily)